MAIERAAMRLLRDRRCSVAVVFAMLLPALIGSAGIAAEIGLWYAIKRQNQSAADEAALAGALEVAEGKSGNVTTVATCAAWRNAFDTAAASSTCVTSFSSPYQITVAYPYSDSEVSNAVEVVLDQSVNALFASYFLPSVTIETRAVAAVVDAGSACDLALDPTTNKALYFQGNTTVNDPTCFFVANSTSNQAVNISGNSTVNALGLQTSGNWYSNGNPTYNFTDGMYVYTDPPLADPYGGLSYTYPTGKCQTAAQTGTLSPGVYCGSMYFKNGANVTLSAGVYYIEGEDNQGNAFRVDTGATVSGTGVTLLAISSNDKKADAGALDIQGGTVSLTAPSTAPSGLSCPNTPNEPSCSGLLFWQDPAFADTKKASSLITASSTSNLTGAIVTPATPVTFTGNSTSSCTIIVALTITFIGNSTMSSAGCAADGVSPPQVFLVVLSE